MGEPDDVAHSEARPDDEPVAAQWSEAARQHFREALSGLIDELRQHGERIVAMTGRQREIPELDACTDAIARAGQLFDDALFDLTGTVMTWDAPFDDDEEDIDPDHDEAPPAGTVVAVLRREDYLLVDPDLVIDAGRQAYLQTWPQDEPDDARLRVDRLGPALYELIHANGDVDPAEALAQTAGLVPGRSTILFAWAPEPLDPTADDPFRDAQGQPLPELYRLTNM